MVMKIIIKKALKILGYEDELNKTITFIKKSKSYFIVQKIEFIKL